MAIGGYSAEPGDMSSHGGREPGRRFSQMGFWRFAYRRFAEPTRSDPSAMNQMWVNAIALLEHFWLVMPEVQV